MRYILIFIFLIQNLILCQDDVDVQLMKEIAQKHAKEDIIIFFKYREPFYLPEQRILNFRKKYPDEYYQLYKYIYLESIENHNIQDTSEYQTIVPIIVGVGVTGIMIYILQNPNKILKCALTGQCF